MGLLDYEQLMSSPLLQAGLGILANNNSRNFGQVIGGGLQQGLGNVAQFQQMAQKKKQQEQEQQMRQQQFDMQSKQFEMQKAQFDAEQAKRKKLEEWQGKFGKPNAESVTSGGYATLPSDGNAPNFNMQKLPDVVTPNSQWDMNTWLHEGIGLGAIPIDKLMKENDPIVLAEGGQLRAKSGKLIAENPKDPTGSDKLPDAVRQFQWAVQNGYINGKDPGAFEKFKQWGAMNPVALAQLGVAQGGLDIRNREADYTLPSRPKPTASKLPKSKLFKLDGGGSVSGTLDPAVGKYYVIQNGKKNWVEE